MRSNDPRDNEAPHVAEARRDKVETRLQRFSTVAKEIASAFEDKGKREQACVLIVKMERQHREHRKVRRLIRFTAATRARDLSLFLLFSFSVEATSKSGSARYPIIIWYK